MFIMLVFVLLCALACHQSVLVKAACTADDPRYFQDMAFYGGCGDSNCGDGRTDGYFGIVAAISYPFILTSAVGYNNWQGTAFIYKDNGNGFEDWQTLPPYDATQDMHYGRSLAIDRSVAAVGAWLVNDNHRGAVYIYTLSVHTDLFEFSTVLRGEDSDLFANVAIHYPNIVVGAPGVSLYYGAAYLVQESTVGANDWAEVFTFTESSPDNPSGVGSHVAIHNDIVVLAAGNDDDYNYYPAGAAIIFQEQSPGVWTQSVKLEDPDNVANAGYKFGAWVDVHDGTVAISEIYEPTYGNEAGAVFVYRESSPGAEDWALLIKLFGSDTGAMDEFGHSCDVWGPYIIVSIERHDRGVYVFQDMDGLGAYVEIHKTSYVGGPAHIDGHHVVIGPSQPNEAFIYYTKIDGCDILNDNVCGVNPCGEFSFDCQVGHEVDEAYCSCKPPATGALCDACTCGGENGTDQFACSQDDIDGVYRCDCTGGTSVGVHCSIPCIAGVASDSDWTQCNCQGTHNVGIYCENTCYNGYSDVTSTTCNCTNSGATGKYCTKDIDDCASNPCLNEGTCTDAGKDWFPMHHHEFNCTCTDAWRGDLCEISTFCDSSPCFNNGTCHLDEISGYCNCTDTGYNGESCQTDIDDCASSPCLNDGVCTDLLRGFSCDCTGTGYEGSTCFKDIDDCASSPCLNDGVCQDKGANKFKCNCNEYWEGKTCDANIDDCVTNACQNEAICVDGLGNYTCNCTMAGYEGEFCDMDIDDCASNPCLNEGTCYDSLSSFTCECMTAYEGDVCDVYVPCLSTLCENGGTCIDDVCLCDIDYTGSLCETLLGVNDNSSDHTVEPIVFLVSFDTFYRDNDTAESFQVEFATLLSAATPGTTPNDYTVELLSSNSYQVTFENTQNLDAEVVLASIESNPQIAERIGGLDVAVQNTVEEEEDENKGNTEEDINWLIILLIFIGIALFGGAGYAAHLYLSQRNNKLEVFKLFKSKDTLSLPA